MCRAALAANQLIEPAKESADEAFDIDTDSESSKTVELMKIVGTVLEDPESKVVIFSQWTSFLNIVQAHLRKLGVEGISRIDGTMSPKERDRNMAEFNNVASTRIILASLGACSVGVNLVAGNTVVLCDSCKSAVNNCVHARTDMTSLL